MVPSATIYSMLFTALVCFGFPVVLIIALRKKQRGYFGPVVVGMISFFLFQIVIRIPIMQTILPNLGWYQNSSLMFKIFFAAITAALFETFGRWFTMKLLMKDRHSYFTGILHGVGHGGIEAIMLIGINYIIYSVFSIQVNEVGATEFLASFTSQGVEVADSMKQLVNVLVEEKSWMFLVSGYERLMTMIIHIGLSLLMMQGFVNKKVPLIALITFVIHFALDYGSVALHQNGVNLFLVEGYITLFAVALVLYVLKARVLFNNVIEANIENQKYIDSDY